MPHCFVIQPFDGGKFDKRFEDVFKPAILDAGLDPYRVDRDPSVEIPIESIEEQIRNASVCLADITTDNPNVWYELGFAFAAGRPVVMVCSSERTLGKFPFDIQHRTIILYKPESPSDFESLKKSITEKVKALQNKSEAIRQITESEQVAPNQGLSQSELLVFANLAGETTLPGDYYSLQALKEDSERSGLTPIGFSLALRRLVGKRFVEISEQHNEYQGYTFNAGIITPDGWKWLDENESLFALRKAQPEVIEDSDIPF